ncbi:MAG TPA: thioredoxin [Anaerolineales bacterium]
MSKPVAVTDIEFEKTVLQSEVPVIVDFWAPWCTPCKVIAPVLENIAQEYDGKLIVAKVNTDENPKWAMRYGVQGIPTLLFISGGKAIDHHVGVSRIPKSRELQEVSLH